MTGNYNGFTGKFRDSVQKILVQWWADGLPSPSRCFICGQTNGAIHAHLEDYNRPHTYLELCIACHLTLHTRHRRPKEWTRYITAIDTGWQHPPTTQKDGFTTMIRETLNHPLPDPHNTNATTHNPRGTATLQTLFATTPQPPHQPK